MAEVNFYLNDNERMELFDFLSKKEAFLVPDIKYLSEEYCFVRDSNEFINMIESDTVGFYIESSKFSLYPLYLKQNRFINEPAFFVAHKYGGQYIDLALYRGYADDAKVKYKCTWLSIYPKFIKLQEEYEEFKATEESKEFYNLIIKFIKSISKQITIDGKKYWIGKKAIEEMESDGRLWCVEIHINQRVIWLVPMEYRRMKLVLFFDKENILRIM